MAIKKDKSGEYIQMFNGRVFRLMDMDEKDYYDEEED